MGNQHPGIYCGRTNDCMYWHWHWHCFFRPRHYNSDFVLCSRRSEPRIAVEHGFSACLIATVSSDSVTDADMSTAKQLIPLWVLLGVLALAALAGIVYKFFGIVRTKVTAAPVAPAAAPERPHTASQWFHDRGAEFRGSLKAIGAHLPHMPHMSQHRAPSPELAEETRRLLHGALEYAHRLCVTLEEGITAVAHSVLAQAHATQQQQGGVAGADVHALVSELSSRRRGGTNPSVNEPSSARSPAARHDEYAGALQQLALFEMPAQFEQKVSSGRAEAVEVDWQQPLEEDEAYAHRHYREPSIYDVGLVRARRPATTPPRHPPARDARPPFPPRGPLGCGRAQSSVRSPEHTEQPESSAAHTARASPQPHRRVRRSRRRCPTRRPRRRCSRCAS